ncbi:lamin tail domain-containing protein [Patescibacteria group bacterium]
MPAKKKTAIDIFFSKNLILALVPIAISAIFLFLPKSVFAQLAINEFLPNSKPGENEWVELYNLGASEINLSGWVLTDSAAHDKTLDHLGSILPGNFVVYEYPGGDGWLNNSSGDSVILKEGSETKDSYFYSLDPSEDISFGRYPDGTGAFGTLSSKTPGSANSSFVVPSPTPSPTPTESSEPTATPFPTPTPTDSPTSASYQINDAKNEDGETINNAKVYVDGVYLHHYAPETLTFCDGCSCDDYVGCGFGEHTIKVEKGGYEDWSETRSINAGDGIEVNPVLNSADSSSVSTPTLSLTPTLTPTPSSSPTPVPSVSPVPEGEVLGEKSDQEFFPLGTPSPSPQEDEEEKNNDSLIAKIFFASGLVFLFSGGLWAWYNLIQKENFGRKKSSKIKRRH